MSLGAWIEIGAGALVVALVWSTISSFKAHGRAVATAEQATGETRAARALADQLSDSAQVLREQAQEARAEAQEERARADLMADSLRAAGAVLSVTAAHTGASLLDVIQVAQGATEGQLPALVDSMEVRLERHLEADRQVAENFQQRLAEMQAGREAADLVAASWQAQAQATQRALEARELECQSCAEEAERWRAAAQPSFFRGLLDDAGKLVVTVAGTALVVLLL